MITLYKLNELELSRGSINLNLILFTSDVFVGVAVVVAVTRFNSSQDLTTITLAAFPVTRNAVFL